MKTLSLVTLQTPNHDITIEFPLLPQYQLGGKYFEIVQQAGWRSFVWCLMEQDAKSTHVNAVEWRLDVPEDKCKFFVTLPMQGDGDKQRGIVFSSLEMAPPGLVVEVLVERSIPVEWVKEKRCLSVISGAMEVRGRGGQDR